RQRLLQALPRQGHAVFLRLFRERRRYAGGGAAEQASPDRVEAAAEAWPEDPRHRQRLGRSRLVSRGDGGRGRYRRHALEGAVRTLQREGSARRTVGSRALRAPRLSQGGQKV